MIEWSESVDIDRPFKEVLSAVRDQRILMQWSAWPQATGYTCAVDGDGTTPGSSIVFTSPVGQEMGRQTITDANATTVRNRLRNRRVRPLHRADLANLKRLLETGSP